MKRQYIFFALIICFLLFLFLGCARMNVSVEILNRAYWATPKYRDSTLLANIILMHEKIINGNFAIDRETLKESLGLIENDEKTRKQKFREIDTAFKNAQGNYTEAYNKVSKEHKLTPEARDLYAKGSENLALIKNDISKTITSRGEEQRKDVKDKQGKTDDAKKEAEKKETLAAKAKKEAEAVKTRPEASQKQILAEEAKQAVEQAKQAEDTAKNELKKIEKAEENVNKMALSGLIGAATIRGDPRASAVVYAPHENWNEKFNQTICNGYLGNTDCAVKMEDLGDFTIKGVRLDAAKITEATFSVAKETIQIAAALYGFPVPKAKGAKDGEPNVEDTSPGKLQREAEMAILQLRLARIAMLETIVAQNQALKDAKRRPQAIENIKQSIAINCKLIDSIAP